MPENINDAGRQKSQPSLSHLEWPRIVSVFADLQYVIYIYIPTEPFTCFFLGGKTETYLFFHSTQKTYVFKKKKKTYVFFRSLISR